MTQLAADIDALQRTIDQLVAFQHRLRLIHTGVDALIAERTEFRTALQDIMQVLGPVIPRTVDYADKDNLAGLLYETNEALHILRRTGIEYRQRKQQKTIPVEVPPPLPLVFLSGPFTETADTSTEMHLAHAAYAALWCVGRGVPFLCPNLLGECPSFARLPYEAFLGFVLNYLLPHAKLLVMLGGWRESNGCHREHDRALQLGIEVIEWEEFKERMTVRATQ